MEFAVELCASIRWQAIAEPIEVVCIHIAANLGAFLPS